MKVSLKNPVIPLHADSLEAKVKRMKYSHIVNTVNTTEAAFKGDPLFAYLDGPPDARRFFLDKFISRVTAAAILVVDVRGRRAFTIDGGDAFALLYPPGPPDAPHKGLFAALKSLDILQTAEQRKRAAEFSEKQSVALKDAVGDRVKEMLSCRGLATTPKKQGRGYGTMLVARMTAEADAQGRAMWLTSSNILNTGFYESCGFVSVAEFTLGDGNPTWKTSPVIIRVMVREPRGLDGLDEKTGCH